MTPPGLLLFQGRLIVAWHYWKYVAVGQRALECDKRHLSKTQMKVFVSVWQTPCLNHPAGTLWALEQVRQESIWCIILTIKPCRETEITTWRDSHLDNGIMTTLQYKAISYQYQYRQVSEEVLKLAYKNLNRKWIPIPFISFQDILTSHCAKNLSLHFQGPGTKLSELWAISEFTIT